MSIALLPQKETESQTRMLNFCQLRFLNNIMLNEITDKINPWQGGGWVGQPKQNNKLTEFYEQAHEGMLIYLLFRYNRGSLL